MFLLNGIYEPIQFSGCVYRAGVTGAAAPLVIPFLAIVRMLYFVAKRS